MNSALPREAIFTVSVLLLPLSGMQTNVGGYRDARHCSAQGALDQCSVLPSFMAVARVWTPSAFKWLEVCLKWFSGTRDKRVFESGGLSAALRLPALHPWTAGRPDLAGACITIA